MATAQITVTLSDEEKAELKGEDGLDSTVPGPRGYSAYEVAVLNGFVGTEQEWLASLKGEPGKPGTGGTTSGILLDSFPGNDDEKLTAALSYAAAQSRIPAVYFPERVVTLTRPQTPFSGMKLIGPNPGGPMNLELSGGKFVNHKVAYSGLTPLFTNTGTLYDVYVAGLAFQGNLQQQFWRSTGNLYACKFHNLTFYGFKHVFGSSAEKSLFTYTKFTGSWQVLGFPRTMQFHWGGSDNDMWTDGDINVGVTNTQAPGEFMFWFDGMGKTNVGSLYATAGNNPGIRISGNNEGSPLNFLGMRLEGYHSGNPATTLLQIDSGNVHFGQTWFAYGRQVTVNPNARVSYSQCSFSEVPLQG